MQSSWQLTTPLSSIIFDCDGTLSSIEGIDYLAEQNGVGAQVTALTADAMGKTGLNFALYEQRLQLVKPTKQQVADLEREYISHVMPAAAETIALFQRLNKKVYIISAGLYPAVAGLAKHFNVPAENVYAVNIEFDTSGKYVDFDRTSPLASNRGKREIITQLKEQSTHLALIGDGLNDYAAHDMVERFIGYGGSYFRQNIADLCQFYIATPSFSALLPLCLTATEIQTLLPTEKQLYQQGLAAIENNYVKV